VWSASHAQLPFYTDDAQVTELGTLHLEVFDELDALQSAQYPDLRQNTFNWKLNAGLPAQLELDVDAPYLTIDRSTGVESSHGIGDTEFGLKWKYREASAGSHRPTLAASFYVEVPTGNSREELGSGLTDYWLNLIAEEALSEHTRVNLNLGILFAGNTSTGVVGIQTRRGHVLTGGLSWVHDLSEHLSVGAEVYGGIADDLGLNRTQLQSLMGAQYSVSRTVTLSAALIAGKYAASPRFGGQLGIAVDFPRTFATGAEQPTLSFTVTHDGEPDGL
jgi:hypothetical protein